MKYFSGGMTSKKEIENLNPQLTDFRPVVLCSVAIPNFPSNFLLPCTAQLETGNVLMDIF